MEYINLGIIQIPGYVSDLIASRCTNIENAFAQTAREISLNQSQFEENGQKRLNHHRLHSSLSIYLFLSVKGDTSIKVMNYRLFLSLPEISVRINLKQDLLLQHSIGIHLLASY